MENLLILLIPALIQVESGGLDNAIGDSGNAVGCLQIWKICVDDVNRIQKEEVFTYDDRYDRAKSVRMAEIYLTHYGRAYERRTGKKANAEVLAALWCSGPNGYKKMDKPGVKRYIEKVRKELKNTRRK